MAQRSNRSGGYTIAETAGVSKFAVSRQVVEAPEAVKVQDLIDPRLGRAVIHHRLLTDTAPEAPGPCL